MTTRETLLALAERCEKAAGPDHRLDVLIENALGLAKFKRFPDTLIGDSDYIRCDIKPLTASLDAAMTLVPDGHEFGFQVKRYHDGAGCEVGVWREGDDGRSWSVDAEAATPALALTAACLRARAEALSNGEGE